MIVYLCPYDTTISFMNFNLVLDLLDFKIKILDVRNFLHGD